MVMTHKFFLKAIDLLIQRGAGGSEGTGYRLQCECSPEALLSGMFVHLELFMGTLYLSDIVLFDWLRFLPPYLGCFKM